MKVTAALIKQFQSLVFPYYQPPLVRDLPWRKTDDPYAILVSEIMLQQTQVPRVIEKYKTWIKRFPTVYELEKVGFDVVLPYWLGLGYNRRAMYLHRMAYDIVHNHRGVFPTSPEALQRLPGVGHYTARAICVYAYNQPLPLIETNVRTVYIYHFFPNSEIVSDEELLPLVLDTLDYEHPRAWFNALMDYGTEIKMKLPNPSRKSNQYTKQSPLKGSIREVRGWILRQLASSDYLTIATMNKVFAADTDRVTKAWQGLVRDGLVVYEKNQLRLKINPGAKNE